MIGRREFIAGIGGAAVCPLGALGQHVGKPAIGVLALGIRDSFSSKEIASSFRDGLKESGYLEGRDVDIDYRFAEFHNERLPVLAADLATRHAAVIAALGNPAAAIAAKAATTAIPIVFANSADPVALGLVQSPQAGRGGNGNRCHKPQRGDRSKTAGIHEQSRAGRKECGAAR